MRKTRSGFTIVEILITISIVGVLAGIAMIAYIGSRTSAQNTSRISEMRLWQKAFIEYKAANNGNYPSMPDGGYCLGTGFPSQKCRDYNQPINFYTEAASTALMTALKSYDAPISNYPRIPVKDSIGPYVEYSTSVINLTVVMQGKSTDCPSFAFYVWDDGGGRLLCRIALQR